MSGWKELKDAFNEVFMIDTESDEEKAYDKVAEKVMNDTKNITNAVKLPKFK